MNGFVIKEEPIECSKMISKLGASETKVPKNKLHDLFRVGPNIDTKSNAFSGLEKKFQLTEESSPLMQRFSRDQLKIMFSPIPGDSKEPNLSSKLFNRSSIGLQKMNINTSDLDAETKKSLKMDKDSVDENLKQMELKKELRKPKVKSKQDWVDIAYSPSGRRISTGIITLDQKNSNVYTQSPTKLTTTQNFKSGNSI